MGSSVVRKVVQSLPWKSKQCICTHHEEHAIYSLVRQGSELCRSYIQSRCCRSHFQLQIFCTCRNTTESEPQCT